MSVLEYLRENDKLKCSWYLLVFQKGLNLFSELGEGFNKDLTK